MFWQLSASVQKDAHPSPFNGTRYHAHLIAMSPISFTVLVRQQLLLVVDHFLLKYLWLLPVSALGAKIAYFSFSTSAFEWLNKVILCNISCDRSIVTLLFNIKLSITITSITKNRVEKVCFHFQWFNKKWCKKIMKVKSLLIQRSFSKVKVCRLNLKIYFLSVWWNRFSIKYLNTILTQTFVEVIRVAIMRTVAFVENRSCPKEDKKL